jgi:membrane AbrB-like protein
MASWRVRDMSAAARFWSAVAVAFSAFDALLNLVGAPSAHLLAGLAAGAVCALGTTSPLPAPKSVRLLASAIVGVAAGSMINDEVLHVVADQPLVTLGGSAATLMITMGVGQMLRLSRMVDQPTAMFASIAGGASGVTLIARELGADEAIVVSVQYLRVLTIMFTVPFIAPLLAHDPIGGTRPVEVPGWDGLPYASAALLAGILLTRWVQFTASQLVVPMLTAVAIGQVTTFPSEQVPPMVVALGFAGVGLVVGLQLTRRTIGRASRLIPLALLTFVIGIPACAAVGYAFVVSGVSDAMTGHLATSPGGLPGVIAVAVDQQTDVGLVVSCQSIRVVMALILASALGAYVRRKSDRDASGALRPRNSAST